MAIMRLKVLAAAIVVGICAALQTCVADNASRIVTLRDGIEMTTVVGHTCGSVASFSPSERRFVVVLRRGDPKLNVNHYVMMLWRAPVIGPTLPRVLLRMRSSSYFPAIDQTSISWSRSGQTMTFIGQDMDGRQQVFELNLETHDTLAITDSPTNVTTYSIDRTGSVLAYEAVLRTQSIWDAATRRHGLAVTNQKVQELVSGKILMGGDRRLRRLFVQDLHGTREVEPMPGSKFVGIGSQMDQHNVSISPNGRYLVTLETVPKREIPAAWHKYHDFMTQMSLNLLSRRNVSTHPYSLYIHRYVLVDLRTGRSRVLLNAPVLINRPVIWAPNNQAVIISETLLPINGQDSKETLRAASVRTTVEVNIGTGAVTRVGRRCYVAKSWRDGQLICDARPDADELKLEQYNTHTRYKVSSIVEASQCLAQRMSRFEKSAGVWRMVGRPTSPRISVFVREGMNFPPKLYYRIRGQRHGILLLNLNPQFARVRFAREEIVSWHWSKRKTAIGGLYFPLNYKPGRHYPLVIQTHGFAPSKFWFFGSYPTAMAAQPLAAHNMFVLQVGGTRFGIRRGWQLNEVNDALQIYRSAIAYLTRRGLIDPKKVGIVGFSRTCLYVKWALVHDPRLFAAASVTQGVDDGYLQYLLGENGRSVTGLYGGRPFGRHLRKWMELSPGFNLDRVRTPLLITVPNRRYLLWDWGWFEGLHDLGKPVYMVVFHGGDRDSHVLQRPRDRLLVSRETIQWFNYWLNGRIDGAAADSTQYARWRRLRASFRQGHGIHSIANTTGSSKPHIRGTRESDRPER